MGIGAQPGARLELVNALVDAPGGRHELEEQQLLQRHRVQVSRDPGQHQQALEFAGEGDGAV